MSDDDFWSRVAKGPGCWTWEATRHQHGYGLFWDGERQVRAHRHSWEMASGQQVPVGMSVLHSCDNRACVRPDHLRVGTQRENMADMDARGRRAPVLGRPQSGEQNNNARLTRDQVAHIRGMVAAGHYHDDIAALYGCTKANVAQIARRHSWADVEPVPYLPVTRDRPVGRSAPRKRAERARCGPP